MIAVVFALDFEAKGFRAPANATIWVLGRAGASAAEKLTSKITGNPPSLLVSAGLAGGLQPELHVGKFFFAENFSSPECLARFPKEPRRRLITLPSVCETAAEKRRLSAEADAVDMESSHIHSVCKKFSVPLLVTRCVSDDCATDFPVPSHLLIAPESGQPQLFALCAYLAIHPLRWLSFARMVAQARQARAALHAGLYRLLNSPQWKS